MLLKKQKKTQKMSPIKKSNKRVTKKEQQQLLNFRSENAKKFVRKKHHFHNIDIYVAAIRNRERAEESE